MAYKYNWNPESKPSEKDLKAYLEYITPDHVDTAFLVVFAHDDGGRHAVIMAEWDENGDSPWSPDEAIDGKGWRVLRMSVPDGYLRVFYNTDGTKKKTKDADGDAF
jgi:hypothetical protein